MSDSTQGQRRVLMLSYSYTGQVRELLGAASSVFSEAGFEVHDAQIEFTDPRYSAPFQHFPMRRVWPDMLSVLPAQIRKHAGEISVGPDVTERRYDLVCLGSPTWWSAPAMPMRSFLVSDAARNLLAGTPFAVFVTCRDSWKGNLEQVRKLGQWQGGHYLGGMHVEYPGDQVRSMLSLTSYLGSGEYRDTYLGVRIPSTNVQPEHRTQATEFAGRIVAEITGSEVH